MHVACLEEAGCSLPALAQALGEWVVGLLKGATGAKKGIILSPEEGIQSPWWGKGGRFKCSWLGWEFG